MQAQKVQTQKLDIAAIPVAGAAGDGMRVDIFDSMAPLEAEWRALEQDDLASFHQSYDWCAAWVETFRYPLAIVRGSFNGRTAFILPLEIIRSHGIRRAEFIGARHSNINTGLFSSEFLETAENGFSASQQAEIARALQGKADLMLLRNVPLDWRGRKSPLASMPAVENQNHAFQLPFLGAFEATLKQVNAKRRRKKFNHQSRLLNEKGGYEYVIAAPDQRDDLLDLFFRQKAVRFEAAGLPDVFQDAPTQAVLHRLLELGNKERSYAALEMHALRLKGEHEGHIPAVAALSRKGDHVICQFASIDEALVPEASPGELLFWLMIERLHREGAAVFDFGIGDQNYKRSWCPMETTQHDLILPVSGIGHAAAFAQRGMTRAKAAIKTNPQLYGLIQRLRARQSGKETSAAEAEKD
ncbi:GNAT family N-acetyltransferase [Rhizobium sp. BR 317]|uniref:CelD/BcsL family acetyltransferase involved in cellulose biosynthesis n=1 Tax=Rhizobium paranaense TaxID=1650438 RepID=A0A7W8XMT2_9HYPH|nr:MULTISPECIES: GNAT family N-acetyltransferase [Rhizobium]MBB5572124.1 CelD/BcsL family acetyltransferase involved in cellulose biosynthesis [Rhizobium paranaense]PST63216.1 cellulose biosynthesis protein CelD [Rhizobium sp. SEMIA4064]